MPDWDGLGAAKLLTPRKLLLHRKSEWILQRTVQEKVAAEFENHGEVPLDQSKYLGGWVAAVTNVELVAGAAGMYPLVTEVI